MLTAPSIRTVSLTAENLDAFADLAATSSLGKMPKPPPGYKQNRTKGFPLPDLEMLFGHVLNALGPDVATIRNEATPTDASGEKRAAAGGASAGSKRARSPAGDEGGGKRRSGDAGGTVKSNGDIKTSRAMEVDAAGGEGKRTRRIAGEGVTSELEPQSEPTDSVEEGLETGKKAFLRVLGVWEGVATEGKRGLHQRVVARLGRMLAEAEATALAQGKKVSESEVKTLTVVGLCVICQQESARKLSGGKNGHSFSFFPLREPSLVRGMLYA